MNVAEKSIVLLCLAALLGSCSGQGGVVPAEPAAGAFGHGIQRSREQAGAGGVRSLQASGVLLSGFLPVQREQEQAQAALPPLPMPGHGDSLLRRGSDTELITVFGNEALDADAGATDQGQAKVLSASAGSYAWAIYQIPAISTADQEIVQISARVSNASFSESNGGYWVAVADYERHNWDFLRLTQAETYQHSIGQTQPLISPAGNMYIAVLLGGGQSMHVEFVRQTREDVQKTWFVVDPNIAGDHGSWPAAAMSLSGVPMVAYINNVNGFAYFLQPDPTSDFNQTADWNNPPQPLFAMQDADGRDLDMILDPTLGLPRVSLILDKVYTPNGKNSTIGLSAARVNGQNQLEWLSLELAGVDGAQYSSIARDASTGLYAISTSAENLNSPGEPNFDVERREFDVQQLLNLQNVDIEVEKHFGPGLRFPHMRYNPAGNEAYAVKGGFMIYEDPLDVDFISIYEEPDTEPWGSVCFMPAAVSSPTLLGNSYAKNTANGGQLFSAAFDDSLLGAEDQVDSISGAGSWIGGVSQLEYQLDGTPCLAYSYSDGSAIGIRFAIYRNNAWQLEQVSSEPIANVSDRQQIVLDLAVEPPGMFVQPSGRLIIVWDQFDGSASELRVAVRQPGA